MIQLDRRTFLVGGAGAVVLAACGGGDDGADIQGSDGSSDAGDTTTSGLPEFLLPTFPEGVRSPDTIIVAGSEQRLVFVVRDAIDLMRDNAPDELRFEVTFGDTVVLDELRPAHRDGIITPYYTVVFTPEATGEYVVRIPEYADVMEVPVRVDDPADVPLVQIGEPMRPVDTPTVDDERGIERLCTRAVPCDFHSVTLSEALASGKPTVLLIATPGFCQTEACGPVLDLLIDATAGRDDLAIVHAEPWENPSAFAEGAFPDTTEVVDTYALPFEPELLVADATGTVVARLDAVFDRSELADALALV